jgi:GDSL-like Lipase/Acylhydrolase
MLLLVNGANVTKQASAMFVFGDSLTDNGNNNYLNSIAKSNYYPYGIDFFEGPTGRFSNGKTVIDGICKFIYIVMFCSGISLGNQVLFFSFSFLEVKYWSIML